MIKQFIQDQINGEYADGCWDFRYYLKDENGKTWDENAHPDECLTAAEALAIAEELDGVVEGKTEKARMKSVGSYISGENAKGHFYFGVHIHAVQCGIYK